MEQPQIVYVQQQRGSGWIWLVILLLAAGGGLYYWSKRKTEALTSESELEEEVITGTLGGGTNTWKSPVDTDKSYQTPPTGGGGGIIADGIIADIVNTVLPSTAFPLKLATGADLHKSNPYVKDVQQYCNKAGGYNIDIDGAFGKQTENAVFKVFGTKTISKEQYNSTVAPSLGKSLV